MSFKDQSRSLNLRIWLFLINAWLFNTKEFRFLPEDTYKLYVIYYLKFNVINESSIS